MIINGINFQSNQFKLEDDTIIANYYQDYSAVKHAKLETIYFIKKNKVKSYEYA